MSKNTDIPSVLGGRPPLISDWGTPPRPPAFDAHDVISYLRTTCDPYRQAYLA